MISDRVWEELKAALAEAKHSRAGAPAELSDRDFLEAVWYLNRAWPPLAGFTIGVGLLACSFHALSTLGRAGSMAAASAVPSVRRRFAQARPLLMDSTTVRAHQHAAGAPKKTAATRLWGRSRGRTEHENPRGDHRRKLQRCSPSHGWACPRGPSVRISHSRAWIPTMCSNRPRWTKAMMPTASVSA